MPCSEKDIKNILLQRWRRKTNIFLRSFIQSSYQEEVPSSRQEVGPLRISKKTDLSKTTNFLVILYTIPPVCSAITIVSP